LTFAGRSDIERLFEWWGARVMRGFAVILALAMAAPAVAQPAPLREPGAQALELARMLVEGAQGHAQLSPEMGRMTMDFGQRIFTAPLERELLETATISGTPNCDAAVPACRDAARAAAQGFAEAMLSHPRESAELASAYVLAQRMDERQIGATLAFMRSPAGVAFREARRDIALPPALNWDAERIGKLVREKLPDPRIKLRRDYLERIKDLPRRPLPAAPPAPKGRR
jgi:hypothetical protein